MLPLSALTLWCIAVSSLTILAATGIGFFPSSGRAPWQLFPLIVKVNITPAAIITPTLVETRPLEVRANMYSICRIASVACSGINERLSAPITSSPAGRRTARTLEVFLHRIEYVYGATASPQTVMPHACMRPGIVTCREGGNLRRRESVNICSKADSPWAIDFDLPYYIILTQRQPYVS